MDGEQDTPAHPPGPATGGSRRNAPPAGARRGLLAGAAVVLLALAAALAAHFAWYRPKAEDARALAAVQSIQLPVAMWNALHAKGDPAIPGPYPARLDDLAEHGLVAEDTLAHYRRGAVLEYFPPPDALGEQDRIDWVVIKATTPRGTWAGTLGGDRRWEPAP